MKPARSMTRPSSRLGDALRAVEGQDSDGDGFSNIVELEEGLPRPMQVPSRPRPPAWTMWRMGGTCVDTTQATPSEGDDRLLWSLTHPPRKRPVCGGEGLPGCTAWVLDVCLDSEYWRGQGGRVWNLANSKIGPLRAIKAGPDAGPIPLANYDDDYAFFVFTQTDGRDAREVLTGQTFVTARRVDGQTIYEEWDRTPDEDIDERGQDLYQGVAKERRAGLLTHRWFLMINTMFTSVPRTTAAQAYRAFLGYNLSRLEGLSPVL